MNDSVSVFNNTCFYDYIKKKINLKNALNNINGLLVNININPPQFNAIYNNINDSTNFFDEGNLHYKTNTFIVENHELGHYCHYKKFFNGSGIPMAEGYADIFAIFVYYDTFKKIKCKIGTVFTKSNNPFRNICNDKLYPYDNKYESIHLNSRIFSSCIYDILEYLYNNNYTNEINILEDIIHDIIDNTIRLSNVGNKIINLFYEKYYDEILEKILLLELQNHGLINNIYKYKFDNSSNEEIKISSLNYITLFILPDNIESENYQYTNNFIIENNELINIYYLKEKNIYNNYNLTNIESLLIFNKSENEIIFKIKNII